MNFISIKKYFLLAFLFILLIPFYSLGQQKNIITIDFLLPVLKVTNTPYGGLLYKHIFANDNFAFRAGIDGSFLDNNRYYKDTLNNKSTSLVITPRMGVEYIKHVTDGFSFSFGSDIFLTTTFYKTFSYQNIIAKETYYNYGALPFVCFSFTVNKQFYISAETRCIVNIVTQTDPSGSSVNSKNLSIDFFNDYSVFLGYKF